MSPTVSAESVDELLDNLTGKSHMSSMLLHLLKLRRP